MSNEDHPHKHIIDQHRAARHEAERNERDDLLGRKGTRKPKTLADCPPEKWILGIHYDLM